MVSRRRRSGRSTASTRSDKPPLTFKQIAVVAAGTVDVWVKRPDGADYDDAPPMASAVRASPRSQAWAWSVS
ncbi:hypothetical protein OK006_8279 [Actinobacteria bacterium OK006]|nr:hypothetical protein OK006_8279 [Actinobacteria bacterium OK006]